MLFHLMPIKFFLRYIVTYILTIHSNTQGYNIFALRPLQLYYRMLMEWNYVRNKEQIEIKAFINNMYYLWNKI